MTPKEKTMNKFKENDAVFMNGDYTNKLIINLVLFGEKENQFYYTAKTEEGAESFLLVPENMVEQYDKDKLLPYPGLCPDGTSNIEKAGAIMYGYRYGIFYFHEENGGAIMFVRDIVIRIAGGNVEQYAFEPDPAGGIKAGWYNVVTGEITERREPDNYIYGDYVYSAQYSFTAYDSQNWLSLPEQFRAAFEEIMKPQSWKKERSNEPN